MNPLGKHAEFAEGEAKALVGQEVETTGLFRRIPIRTRGRVVSANLEMPKAATAWAWWRVVVEWEVTDQITPIRDWIAKWEFERYLQLVDEEEEQ